MKVGIFLVLFGRRPLAEALDFVKSAGCEAVEIGTGGYVGNAHCKPHELLEDRRSCKSSAMQFGRVTSRSARFPVTVTRSTLTRR